MYLLSAAAALLALLSGASSQNVVQFNLTQGRPPIPALLGINYGSVPALLGRRATTYPEQLINSVTGAGYYVQVEVGNPPQTQTLLLDTGSSDAWVLGHDADICTSRELQQQHGVAACADTYDAGKSETSAMVERGGFKIVYLDRGTASGDYVADDLTIGGATVKALQLARVTKAVRGTGILGLGYTASERAATKYPNLIDAMTNQGLIDCKAYSLYLNDRRADSGSVLFGGLDTDKFIGPLAILPLSRPPGGGNYSSFEVDFAGVSISFPNGSSLNLPTSLLPHPAPAVLDSGTTLSYLPDKLSQSLTTALGAIYDPDLRMSLIDCHALPSSSPNLSLTFSFPLPNPSSSSPDDQTQTSNTTTINIPVTDLILPLLPASYPAPPSFPSRRACVLGIQSTSTFSTKPVSYALLGATFLRAAYVVHDLSHHQLGIAQANLNSSTSTVVAMSAGRKSGEGGGSGTATGIPSVTGVGAQQTTFTPTATGVGLGVGAGGGVVAGGGTGGSVGSGAAGGRGLVGVVGVVGMGVATGLVIGFGL
ncbi:aspartic peptidase domain-containing protein [Staphylotrichum tortipilum]|uniref:Aspartic peptidase domain-containing protein n=1 Tax=Staphylotrichum tortipilum TaxID=2831512 RepID=A0AAN6RU55_9PEZI|nr:aspartic peptidase domain-containing protein [Staphylotrichum longicolle]